MLLALGTGCGSDNDDHKNPSRQEEQSSEFSTRLNNKLLVAGVRCNGGETTESNGVIYTCNRDQWLIQIDNVNTCDSEGRCTEVAVNYFVADLEEDELISIPEYSYYEIEPQSPVNASQLEIINDIVVRFTTEGDTEVVME